MSKAHLATLGLGGYFSDDEEEAQEGGAEESEGAGGKVRILGTNYGTAASPSSSANDLENGDTSLLNLAQSRPEPSGRPDVAEASAVRAGPEEAEAGANGGIVDSNPLNSLPLELREPLLTTCSEELQNKIRGFISTLSRTSSTFSDSLRNKKEYRNPDFLQKTVEYFGVCDIGSCFAKEVFDPMGLPKEDFVDSLCRQLDRQEASRKGKPREFVSAGASHQHAHSHAHAQAMTRQPSAAGGHAIGGVGVKKSVVAAASLANSNQAAIAAITRQVQERANAMQPTSKKGKWDTGV